MFFFEILRGKLASNRLKLIPPTHAVGLTGVHVHHSRRSVNKKTSRRQSSTLASIRSLIFSPPISLCSPGICNHKEKQVNETLQAQCAARCVMLVT